MDDKTPPVVDHETDLYGWAKRQATLLREGRVSELETLSLAEEIEEVGSSQYDKLESALRVLLIHMLKWDHQPHRRSRSWSLTIREQRQRVARVLGRNPSLQPEQPAAIAAAWDDAKLGAARETDLPLGAFPAELPYSWQDMTDRPFLWND